MSENSSKSGVGFLGLLTIVFITLKLCDVIDWSWWLVLAPLWIPMAFLIVLLGLAWEWRGRPKVKETKQTNLPPKRSAFHERLNQALKDKQQ